MGEESSETESETNENDQRMPDDFFPGESKMDSDIDSEIQRHTSIQSNSNSESSLSLNDVNFAGPNQLPISGIGLLSQAQHHHLTPESRKFRNRSNDSARSDFSDSVASETFKATAQRRGSGSLSPRLIQFKRRESIDSIINEEKNHEHEINDLKNLNSKVEDLFESKTKKLASSDTPSNSPKRRHLGKQVFIPSISSTCSSPTRPYQRAQSPLTSTAGSTSTCRKRRFTDQEEFSPISKKPTRPAARSSASLCSTCSFDSDTLNSNSPQSDHLPDFRAETNEMDVEAAQV